MSAMDCMAPTETRLGRTRPRMSLALKLPSAFSSVLRVTSRPGGDGGAGGEGDLGKFEENFLLLLAGDEVEARHFAGTASTSRG